MAISKPFKRRGPVWKRAVGGPLGRSPVRFGVPYFVNVWANPSFGQQVGPTFWRTRDDAIEAARDGVVGDIDAKPLYRLRVVLKAA